MSEVRGSMRRTEVDKSLEAAEEKGLRHVEQYGNQSPKKVETTEVM